MASAGVYLPSSASCGGDAAAAAAPGSGTSTTTGAIAGGVSMVSTCALASDARAGWVANIRANHDCFGPFGARTAGADSISAVAAAAGAGGGAGASGDCAARCSRARRSASAVARYWSFACSQGA